MLITEISENDFRKLNLKVYRHERREIDERTHSFKFIERNINDILDEQIEYALKNGYESDLADLQTPVTIALHKLSTGDDILSSCYLDKFMNRFTGAQTFQIGWGISHLYSTRDYYEAHEDYWRVKKKETEVIYRVHLNPRPFVLKHKTVKSDWPYDFLPDGASPDYKSIKLEVFYDLQPDGNWKEHSRVCHLSYEHCSHYIPVDMNGRKIKQ